MSQLMIPLTSPILHLTPSLVRVCVHVSISLSDTHMYTYLTQLMTVVFPVLTDPPEDSGLRHRPKTQTSMPVLPGKLHMYIVG